MDFNSLWPRGFGNMLGIWELCFRIRGFIVTGANQIVNFEMKTTNLISKFDSKFANFERPWVSEGKIALSRKKFGTVTKLSCQVATACWTSS